MLKVIWIPQQIVSMDYDTKLVAGFKLYAKNQGLGERYFIPYDDWAHIIRKLTEGDIVYRYPPPPPLLDPRHYTHSHTSESSMTLEKECHFGMIILCNR